MRIFSLVAVLSLCAAPAFAETAPLKVGVVDFAKIFGGDHPFSRADRAELDKMMADQQAKVDGRKSALDRERADFASRSPKMDPAARAKREAELDNENAALRQLFQQAQTAVQKRERELTGRVVSDAKALAPQVAKAHGVALVLGAPEALLWTAPGIVQVDLTGEIAHRLDMERAKAQPTAKVH